MVLKAIENLLTRSIIRFFIVAVIATCFNYLIFYLLLQFLHVDLYVSSAVGFLSGVFLGYQLNKLWTYRSINKKVNLVKYYGVYLFSLGISLLCLELFVNEIQVDARVANVMCIGVTFFTNYAGTRFWVFR